MVLLSAFTLLVAAFVVRASEYGANREVDCEPQWHVDFVGKVQNNAQTCFEYELKFTPNKCQKATASWNSRLGLSLSFEFPLDSRMAAKNPFVVDETVAAIKSLLTASQPFVVVPRSDRSVIEVQLQPISVADMQLADTGFGTVIASTRIKLCTAARVPHIYGACILQPVFNSADNVLELVGDSLTAVLPLPDPSSLLTVTQAIRHVPTDSSAALDSSFGSVKLISLDQNDQSMHSANNVLSSMSLSSVRPQNDASGVRQRVSPDFQMSDDWNPEFKPLSMADLQLADTGAAVHLPPDDAWSENSNSPRPLVRTNAFRIPNQNGDKVVNDYLAVARVLSDGTDDSRSEAVRSGQSVESPIEEDTGDDINEVVDDDTRAALLNDVVTVLTNVADFQQFEDDGTHGGIVAVEGFAVAEVVSQGSEDSRNDAVRSEQTAERYFVQSPRQVTSDTAVADEMKAALLNDVVILPMAVLKQTADGRPAMGGRTVQMTEESRAAMERALALQLDRESNEQRWNQRGSFNSPALSVDRTSIGVLQALRALRAIRDSHLDVSQIAET